MCDEPRGFQQPRPARVRGDAALDQLQTAEEVEQIRQSVAGQTVDEEVELLRRYLVHAAIAARDGLDRVRLLARPHHLEIEVDRKRVPELPRGEGVVPPRTVDVLHRPLLQGQLFSLGDDRVSGEAIGLGLVRDGVAEAAGPRVSAQDAGKARLGRAGAPLLGRKAAEAHQAADVVMQQLRPRHLGVDEAVLVDLLEGQALFRHSPDLPPEHGRTRQPRQIVQDGQRLAAGLLELGLHVQQRALAAGGCEDLVGLADVPQHVLRHLQIVLDQNVDQLRLAAALGQHGDLHLPDLLLGDESVHHPVDRLAIGSLSDGRQPVCDLEVREVRLDVRAQDEAVQLDLLPETVTPEVRARRHQVGGQVDPERLLRVLFRGGQDRGSRDRVGGGQVVDAVAPVPRERLSDDGRALHGHHPPSGRGGDRGQGAPPLALPLLHLSLQQSRRRKAPID